MSMLRVLFVSSFALFTSIKNAVAVGLPTPTAPTGYTAGSGDYLAFLRGLFGDNAEVVALFISTALFLWAAWITFSKFNEARNSKEPDWGSVGLYAFVCGAMLLLSTFLLNEAVGVI